MMANDIPPKPLRVGPAPDYVSAALPPAPPAIERWVYRREAGDIELWAASKDEAMTTLHQHGFTKIDPDKLGRG